MEINFELDSKFYEGFLKVSKEIDPDFELTAPMMLLKHFMHASVDLLFRNSEDFDNYCDSNAWIRPVLFLCNKPNKDINEEMF